MSEESKPVPDSTGFILNFPPDLFRDYGEYFELQCPQKSAQWLEARKKRVTGSIFAQAAGLSPYKTRTQLLREMAGLARPADFHYMAKQAMMNGVVLEPYVRSWYETEYRTKVVERGLIIPKWCRRIGVSVDGEVIPKHDGKIRQKGIIEIKCPMNMYPELVDISHRKQKGEVFDELYKDHLKPDHYAQMQGGMAILNADYCDYIVYVGKTNEFYSERIVRNKEYWEKELYPKLLSFIEEMDRLSVENAPEPPKIFLLPQTVST